MTKKMTSVLALAGVIAAAISTAALADRGDGPGRGGEMLLDRFDEIDADKNGAITEAEIDAFRAARFAAADTNADGGLDAAELGAWHLAEVQARLSDRSTRMLEDRDADGDGKLTAAEMEAPARPFGRADADGDGQLTKAEAEAAIDEMGKRGRRHGRGG